MNSERKVVTFAALAFSLLVVTTSAYAAQHQQAKSVSAKPASIYLLENNGSNTRRAESFQNNFAIEY